MSKPKRYLITAALPYANGPLHIGHIAGAYLPADIYVRYLKNKGEDVAFICGSDEHGAAITIKALKEKTTPQAIIDQYHTINKQAFADFGINFDIYHRTSEKLHHETAQDFFTTLLKNNAFITETSEQYYDEEFKQFLADRYIIGTCPTCQNDKAYGDQCEKCGRTLSPNELINPTSTLSGKKPVLKTTKHWYFPLNEHEPFLKNWILEQHKNDWKTNVYGQCKSWLDAGLQPRAMTRDLDWGVKVPLPDAEGKVLYVWLDAPIGYISATKQWAKDHGKDWEPYWKDRDTQLVHFIGKDNIVFHCIIFPSLLRAHGGYIMPDYVPANEFLNLEGDKISTSRNHAVWLHEYLHDFPNKQDELRYVLCSIAPETKDSEFTWADYQARINNELVAILGNFVNRSFVLVDKFYEGKIPSFKSGSEKRLFDDIDEHVKNIGENIEKYRFREALSEYMNIARLGNKFLADTEPWKRIKDNPDKAAEVLGIAIEIVKVLAKTGEPFLPNMCNTLKNSILDNGLIKNPGLLFQKIEEEQIAPQLKKLEKPFMGNIITNPAKPNISYDDFSKMDMRVGIILEAEKIPNADKLLKLTIDTGIDKRTVVSGIAQHFNPNDIIGKRVTLLLNLEPRKIRGVESHGMILMAEDDGKLFFVSPTEALQPGSEIR